LAALCLAYFVKRINWLLIEKEEELCYRSLKVGDEVYKQVEKEGTDIKAMIDNRLDLMEQKA